VTSSCALLGGFAINGYIQSVHGFRCYDNISPDVKCQRVQLVLALCLVVVIDEILLN